MHLCPDCGDLCNCAPSDEWENAPLFCWHICEPYDPVEDEEPEDDEPGDVALR